MNGCPLKRTRGVKMKVLFIAASAPYEKAKHAGGCNAAFYLNVLAREKKIELTLITFAGGQDIPKLRYKDKGVHAIVHNTSSPEYHSWYEKCLYDYERNMLCMELRELLKKDFESLSRKKYIPDVVICEWTQMVLMIPMARKFFPASRFIAIEEDVSFQGFYRRFQDEKRPIYKFRKFISYLYLKKKEIKALGYCSKAAVLNKKDGGLLAEAGIPRSRIMELALYHTDYGDTIRKNLASRKIVFFGAMDREENYESAIWFIREVMPLLRGKGFTFYVVGNRPDDKLKQYASEDVVITGFVDDVSLYFTDSLCMAAPLVLGAGIKAKVLEAMSAGIPVLTNQIGIEGILAEDRISYLHCESAGEYKKAIEELHRNPEMIERIGNNGKKLIQTAYDLDKSGRRLLKEVYRWGK